MAAMSKSARYAPLVAFAVALLATRPSSAQPESETAGPEPEESDAKSEADPETCTPACRPGFACANGKCVSACNPPCAGSEICTAALQCIPDPGAEGAEEPEADRERHLVGVRGFAGIVVGGGFSMHTFRTGPNELQDPTTWGAFLFALRGGLLLNQLELGLELAPGTYAPVIGDSSPALDNDKWLTSFTGTVGYHVGVSRSVYWPLRIGAGLMAGNDHTDFQGRLELLNLSIKTKYVLIDFSFPSIRYASDFDDYHRWTGLFNVGVSYVSL
jgi:hypothetical protein